MTRHKVSNTRTYRAAVSSDWIVIGPDISNNLYDTICDASNVFRGSQRDGWGCIVPKDCIRLSLDSGTPDRVLLVGFPIGRTPTVEFCARDRRRTRRPAVVVVSEKDIMNVSAAVRLELRGDNEV